LRRRAEQEFALSDLNAGLRFRLFQLPQAVLKLRIFCAQLPKRAAGGCDLLLEARLLCFQSNMRSFNRGL
jgi:hypothetical protein